MQPTVADDNGQQPKRNSRFTSRSSSGIVSAFKSTKKRNTTMNKCPHLSLCQGHAGVLFFNTRTYHRLFTTLTGFLHLVLLALARFIWAFVRTSLGSRWNQTNAHEKTTNIVVEKWLGWLGNSTIETLREARSKSKQTIKNDDNWDGSQAEY